MKVTDKTMKILFDKPCSERRDLFRSLAQDAAMGGFYDDAQFLLDLIGNKTEVCELVGFVSTGINLPRKGNQPQPGGRR